MKDLSLSLLSRGCGQVISANRNTGRQDGRLDVCFTPQDFYIWKSRNSYWQLSKRGNLLAEEQSTLPKTYSTRRGPLLLYSQDLVAMETSCYTKTKDRNQRVVRQYTQRMKQQLNKLKKLTAGILSYSNNQATLGGTATTQLTSHRLDPHFFPPLRPTVQPNQTFNQPNFQCPSPQPIHSTPGQLGPELILQLNPQSLPAERNTEQLENQLEDEEETQRSKKKVRLNLFLQIPSTSEPLPWVHHAMTPEEEHQAYSDMELQQTESSQLSEINHHRMGQEHHHPNTECVLDVVDDQICTTKDNETISGLLPPLTVGHSCIKNYWQKTDTPELEGLSSDEHCAQRLPPVAESPNVSTQQDTQLKAPRAGFQSQGNLPLIPQQPLFPPLLFPEKREEKIRRQRREKPSHSDSVGYEGGKLPIEKASMILMEPRDGPPAPVGVLGCVTGWKGPGKQSSLAFLQNRVDLQDPCEAGDASRGVVRGILPLELRDLQNGKSVGSLILGPDGEIIQLSLFSNSQDPSQVDSDTQQRALQVLSAEGEKLPWVIVLQPEQTQKEGEVGHNSSGPEGEELHRQSKHKLVSNQPLDCHKSLETSESSPSCHTDPVVVTKKKRSAEAMKKDAKNMRTRPPVKHAGREATGGAKAEAEEDEELGSTGRTSLLSGSNEPGSGEKLHFNGDVGSSEYITNPNEANTEDAVGAKRENTEEYRVTTRKRDLTAVSSAESDGQKPQRTRTEGRQQRQRTGRDAQSVRRHKQEERTNKQADNQNDSAHPSVKKKMTDQDEARVEEKTNEEIEEVKQENESARRMRRKGRLKHKELVDENHEDHLKKEKTAINQEIEEQSSLKSSRQPSATQKHSGSKTYSEDRDCLSAAADKHSSVQSVSSLRSAVSHLNHRSLRMSAASSCEGGAPASTMGLTASRGRLSSCSTVMVTEDQLMLNPVRPESSRPGQSQGDNETAALHLAQRAKRQMQKMEKKRREREEEEKKRREQEEEERRQQQREQTEERMKSDLEEERRKRAEELRLKKLAEEEESRKREQQEQEQMRREQAQKEREKRRQEERRRQMEQLRKMREEEEQRKKAELQRLCLEEEMRQEEERKKLQEMDEMERIEYLRRKEQEEEDRRNKEEERKKAEEEQALQAAEEGRLLARQMALLQQHLAFKRGLMLEAEGLEKTQSISRPWIYSYFTLLQLLGLNPPKAETSTP